MTEHVALQGLAHDIAPESFPLPSRSSGHTMLALIALAGVLVTGLGWALTRARSQARARRFAVIGVGCVALYIVDVLLNFFVAYPARSHYRVPRPAPAETRPPP